MFVLVLSLSFSFRDLYYGEGATLIIVLWNTGLKGIG